MSTLTFLRKFTVRFALGLAVLAIPNVVLATETSGSDTEDGGSPICVGVAQGLLETVSALVTDGRRGG